MAGGPLRFTTWLAPGLPKGLFEAVASQVGAVLGRDVALDVEPKISGPLSAADDRFAQGLTDVGFLCPPSFVWLTQRKPSSIALVPMAPVFDDARAEGRAVYFSDVVVRTDSDVARLEQLAGRRVGFNDRASLSGYLGLLGHLARAGINPATFAQWRCVGSHRNALAEIMTGELDAAAVDANVLRAWQRESSSRGARVRAIETLGPFPVQPIVVRTELMGELRDVLAEILGRDTTTQVVRPFGVRGFAPISAAAYDAIAPLLALA